MITETEILLLPYSSAKNKSLLHLLISEFKSGKWSVFRSAVAFAKQSGNYEDLLEAMSGFAKGGTIEMTFGADTFGGEVPGSEYDAIETLLHRLGENKNVQIHVYREKGRTFHPKLYLFSNDVKKQAMVIMGSSNWSHGGLVNNIEANVLVKLNLAEEDHAKCFSQIVECFNTYWQEIK